MGVKKLKIQVQNASFRCDKQENNNVSFCFCFPLKRSFFSSIDRFARGSWRTFFENKNKISSG